MAHATLTSKGQVTIPRSIRNKLNLKTGDKIDFMMKDGEVLLVPVSKQVSDVFGILSRDGQKTVTVEEMNEVIKERVKNLNS